MSTGFVLRAFLTDGTPVGEKTLNTLPIRIGRNALNDFQLNNKFVSDFHARVEDIEGRLCVRDLGSRNGVYVPVPGTEVPRRVEPQGAADLQPGGFLFYLGPMLQVKIDFVRQQVPVISRESVVAGRVLGNMDVLLAGRGPTPPPPGAPGAPGQPNRTVPMQASEHAAFGPAPGQAPYPQSQGVPHPQPGHPGPAGMPTGVAHHPAAARSIPPAAAVPQQPGPRTGPPPAGPTPAPVAAPHTAPPPGAPAAPRPGSIPPGHYPGQPTPVGALPSIPGAHAGSHPGPAPLPGTPSHPGPAPLPSAPPAAAPPGFGSLPPLPGGGGGPAAAPPLPAMPGGGGTGGLPALPPLPGASSGMPAQNPSGAWPAMNPGQLPPLPGQGGPLPPLPGQGGVQPGGWGPAPVAPHVSPDRRSAMGTGHFGEMALETLALQGLRELAASLVPSRQLDSTGDVARFITKLHDAIEMFCRCFVPLREGHSQFVSTLDLQRAAMQRTQHRSPAYLAVERANTADALAVALLDWEERHLDAPQAVENIFADLMIHQVAILEGVMQGVRALLEQLSPEAIEQAASEPGGFGFNLGGGRSRALWQAYCERYEELSEEKQAFAHIFGPEFTEAYREHRRRRGGNTP